MIRIKTFNKIFFQNNQSDTRIDHRVDDNVNNMRAEYRDDQLPECSYQRHSPKPTEPDAIYISSDDEAEVRLFNIL